MNRTPYPRPDTDAITPPAGATKYVANRKVTTACASKGHYMFVSNLHPANQHAPLLLVLLLCPS